MFDKIKNIFKKEKTYECIVFDGKKMSYPNLTKKQIEKIENDPKYEAWSVTLKREES